MNLISIDPSLISTALVIGDYDKFKIFNYCRESKVYSKTGMTKWYRYAEEFTKYKFINYRTFSNYSDGEIIKLKDYDEITDQIISDIIGHINIENQTKINIEGYNFKAGGVGDIIDLVTFSTLLRKKLFDKISKNITIISPATLKLEACKLSYPPIIKESGKRKKTIKHEWRNNSGIPGGNFTKKDIALSIIENNNLNDYWSNHCRSIKDELMSMSAIPKPYDDINDAIILYNILKKLA